MNVRRMFANAVARRVAALLVAAALAWLGMGKADAQTFSCVRGSNCDQGQAYSQCMAAASSAYSQHTGRPGYSGPAVSPECLDIGDMGGGYRAYQCRLTFATSWYNCTGYVPQVTFYYTATNTCSARGDYVGSPPTSTMAGYVRQGAISCVNGCAATWYNNGDGTWTGMYSAGTVCEQQQLRQNCSALENYVWNAYIGACEPKEKSCSAEQTRNAVTGECEDACPVGMVLSADGTCKTAKSECPAGHIKSPSGGCLPGEGQCAAGEVRRENGTCGKDADGDGVADVDDDDPDNDPKESASGGDTCDAPPACNGGAIDCMQLRIQWRIDCNTRRNRNVSGGSCAAIPVCTGEKCDAMEYAQLLQQWRATCALEKIAAKGDGTGGGGGDAGVVDLLTGPGSINSNAGGGDSLEDGNPWADEGEEYEPDASGYGWSRSCPSPPSFTLPGGQSVQINLTPLCNWVSLGGSLVLILAGLLSLRIVSGGNA